MLRDRDVTCHVFTIQHLENRTRWLDSPSFDLAACQLACLIDDVSPAIPSLFHDLLFHWFVLATEASNSVCIWRSNLPRCDCSFELSCRFSYSFESCSCLLLLSQGGLVQAHRRLIKEGELTKRG